MKPIFCFLFLCLSSASVLGKTDILPAEFYLTEEATKEFCATPQVKSVKFWYDLMSGHITKHLNNSKQSGHNKDVLTNQLITLSYLEFTIHYNEARFLGYTYANASHHLGRLVRKGYWKKFAELPLAVEDQSLIKGALLESGTQIFSRFLPRTLMEHSLELYKTLSWSLAPLTLCGRSFVANLLHQLTDHRMANRVFPTLPTAKQQEVINLLIKAFQTNNLQEFHSYFVAFEQTFLQYTMYATPEVRIPAAMGVLDKMRFIPFNGEPTLSFSDWCKTRNCKKTSLHLRERILFDQSVIGNEFEYTHNDLDVLMNRVLQSRILEVGEFIMNDLYPTWDK